MSNSGICHAPDSAFYDRTKHYTAYAELAACLAAGGRLPKGYAKASKPLIASDQTSTSQLSYSRDQFGSGWADTDGDCQNSRHEALIAQSTAPVRFKTGRGCRVTAGRWVSPFTGEVIHNPAVMDIDHLVPLKWAWEHGAKDWQAIQRLAFANDPVNLLSVEASLNRQKGTQGVESWLPPHNQCQYIARFIRVVKTYKLHLSEQEASQYQEQKVRHCQSENR